MNHLDSERAIDVVAELLMQIDNANPDVGMGPSMGTMRVRAMQLLGINPDTYVRPAPVKRFVYAGIGSRSTPVPVCMIMKEIGFILAQHGWTLRSGAADGADSAFEAGCNFQPEARKEIFIPWERFRGRQSTEPGVFCSITQDHLKLAEELHPNWEAVTRGARLLLARNGSQILGANLNGPCDLVICWTLDGKITGGTGQALRLAARENIPVINLGEQRWKGVPAADVVKAIFEQFSLEMD